jgi:hypothetical protein
MDYFQPNNNNNTLSSPAEFMRIFSERTQQLLSILHLTQKTRPKLTNRQPKENYFVTLLELGQNIENLSHELYDTSFSFKYTTKKLFHRMTQDTLTSKMNHYYELCNKVYQIQSLIHLGIDHFCEEKQSEDKVHVLTHLKEQIHAIRLLLEISIVQFPQLYQEKKKLIRKIIKKNRVSPQLL